MGIMYYVLTPFAWLLNFFYHALNSYGFAIILVAVVIRLLLFPFAIKGKRSMIATTMLSGRLKQLQQQYGKDKERYNMEVQKLYEREKINPMGGCLWSLIPMFVLIPLYSIIRQPLTYMMGLDNAQIDQVAQIVNWKEIALNAGWTTQAAIDKLAGSASAITSGFANSGYNQLHLANLINQDTLPTIQAGMGEAANSIFQIDFNFLGLNLASLPSWKVWEWTSFSWSNIGLFLLVLLSVGTMFLTSMVSMKTNKMNTGAQTDPNMERTNRTMMYTMPLMYLWFGFVMPAGLCVYLIAGSLLSIAQELIAAKLLKKDYEKARAQAAERELREKEEAKQLKAQKAEERARRIQEEKDSRKKSAGKKKPQLTKDETINKSDSREGMRTYARGRNYDPNRFGGVTPYRDPSKPQAAAEATDPDEELLDTQIPELETDAAALPEAVTPEQELDISDQVIEQTQDEAERELEDATLTEDEAADNQDDQDDEDLEENTDDVEDDDHDEEAQ